MPPGIELITSQVDPNSSDPNRPHKRSKRSLFVVGGLLLVIAAGAFAAQIVYHKAPKSKPTSFIQPALSSSQRAKVSNPSVGTSQLTVTDLSSQYSNIVKLLAQALQVSSDITVQGDLSVGGNSTIGGTLQASKFTGNGAGVTNVDAVLLDGEPSSYFTSLLAGAASSVSQFEANAALLAFPNTFTADNTFADALTVGGTTTLHDADITGDASLTGTTTISSLILSSPLIAASGGTGLNAVPVASVLYGQGGPTLGEATPASAGLCLLSGASDVQ
ncbi:MAG TPA: hypothetical protein VMS08_02060, partial [Candidatus Saccharimonadia bacterium]|nr:hypothetical protein [Candidatus Saccharimonadia bacterium]